MKLRRSGVLYIIELASQHLKTFKLYAYDVNIRIINYDYESL